MDKACLLLLLALTLSGTATQTSQSQGARSREQSSFSMETEMVPIEKPVSLPEGALRVLEKDAGVASCMQNETVSPGQLPSSWFVGSQIHLDGPDETDLIVLPGPLEAPQPMHPAPNACFFGAYTAKFWVLRLTGEGYKLVLKVDAHGLGVLKTKRNGYRDIETTVSSLNGSTTTLFRFNGQRYVSSKTPGRTERSARERVR